MKLPEWLTDRKVSDEARVIITPKAVLDTAASKGVVWPLEGEVSNEGLGQILFPDKSISTGELCRTQLRYHP